MTRRRVLLGLLFIAIVIIASLAALVAYLKSPAFDARVKNYIVEQIERQTGATATLKDFGWNLLQQKIRLEGLTLRGLEPAEDAPLAYIARIDIGINIRSLFSRRLDLFELTISKPEFHVLISRDGKSNIPSPKETPKGPAGFQVSVDNFNIVDGSALLNERRIGIDLSLTNLTALLKYHNMREVLEAHLRFDGVLDRAPEVRLAIPYTLSADIDYTRGTILAQRLTITSSRNTIKLQGKISDVTSEKFAGKLDYTGSFQASFLNYFFENDRFGGTADAAGTLEFSKGIFRTQGNMASDAINYEGWQVTKVRSEYAYRYPERTLRFTKLRNAFLGGSLAGEATVENLPGPSRVNVNIAYDNVDATGLSRAYPWDPKYRILSRATGTINGWFEGKLARFDFSGGLNLKSYLADAGDTTAFPLDGSSDYNFMPGEVRVMNADLRLHSTSVKASGLVHATMSDLKVDVVSPDLRDLAFLYANANGSGKFTGSVTGPIKTPVLNGQFTLENYAYQQYKLEQASGGVRLDMATENADLKDVRVKQGMSEVLINGTAALSGTPVDLRVQANRVAAIDIRPYVNREIDGVFSGDLRVTGLSPAVRLEGEVKADNLSLDNRLIGNVRGHVRFNEPLLDIDNLSVQQGDSTLTGNVSFNRMTEQVRFTARVNSVNLQMLYPLGLPDSIRGVIRQADIRGDGTIRQPSLTGNATLEDLTVMGQVFPQARVNLASTGAKVDFVLDTGPSLNLKAQVDTSATGYPFTGTATFKEYRLDNLTGLSEGSIVATGTANLSGSLTDRSQLRGNGRIESATIRIQQNELTPAQPFNISFNSNELTVSNVTLTGPSTQVMVAGTIGLREAAPLNLKVNGQVDLKLIEARFPGLVSAGVVNLEVSVGGTTKALDLRGDAEVSNASLRRPGFFTGLTNVNGSLSFNQNQIRIERLEGAAGGGTVRAAGTAVLQGETVQGMNVQIEATDVRLRGYPEGLRTVINARVNLRGSFDAPSLEGNVEIQSLAFRSTFEEFLALLGEERLETGTSPFGRLRLALHIEGGKNITIQNQLADVEARVDIDLKGTVDQPAITGHIEASGGTLTFQGNRYTVTRGNIDFVDPLRIQPIIDIEAESQVRDYRVILSITGRGDNPKLSMRSDPPLPELELVGLIAGGRTREEIAARSGGTAPTSEQLFQSGAASILFDLLQQRVGNSLGIVGTGRVRIDPYVVGAGTTTARVTFSEQVTRNLTVTYSQDLSSNRQQVILMEYFIGKNTSILASRDEFGHFGLDLRHRTRLK